MINKLLLAFFFLIPGLAFSQGLYATVESNLPTISYTVLQDETIQTIAEKFKTDTQSILSLNKLQISSNLQSGQLLKVPISKVLVVACEGVNCITVHYTTQASEGLYRIGKNFGDIKVAELKALNHLRSDALSKGQVLLMGYIPQSLFEPNINTAKDAKQPASNIQVAPNNLNDKKPVENATKELSIAPMQNAAVKQMPVAATPPANNRDTSNSIHLAYEGSGFFADQYEAGRTDIKLNAAIFKSESGWRDGKFYVLANEPVIGKVIRLKHPVTGIFIFAKVLAELPKLKEKEVINIRLSSAAAAALGFDESSPVFELDISY